MPGGCEEGHICAVWSALLLRLAGRFCLQGLACFFTAFFRERIRLWRNRSAQHKKEARYAKRQETGRLWPWKKTKGV